MKSHRTIKQPPSRATLARTVLLALALLNHALLMAGKSPLPFSDDQITEAVSFIFTASAALAAWWKNNSFTQKAIAADNIMKNTE